MLETEIRTCQWKMIKKYFVYLTRIFIIVKNPLNVPDYPNLFVLSKGNNYELQLMT